MARWGAGPDTFRRIRLWYRLLTSWLTNKETVFGRKGLHRGATMASRGFLGGFGEGGAREDKAGSAAGGESDDLELSLDLSLGGCFGSDPAREAKKQCLARFSSIASICSLRGITDEDLATAEPTPPLHRTSSLPTEYDEAHFQRKAMQCQRRIVAKRKRLERRNLMNSSKLSAGTEAHSGEGVLNMLHRLYEE
ncbi:hypothetical protein EJB05_11423, partial [Eragrostis curvula]